jgi:hypothetical protein
MARRNMLHLNFGPRTHEGAPVRNISTELQLRRSVMACLLWKSQFYEDGLKSPGVSPNSFPRSRPKKLRRWQSKVASA